MSALCPPLNLLADNAIGTLAREDSAAAVQYVRCQAKHWGAVAAYEALRQTMIRANAEDVK
ncbi:hypothetical protein [Sphingobium boeckii]|uniref:Uncharacterized protein n=1 Tax=Sphingobium boeckii TaxID=1082345 RepID=A0A7W9AEP5_9SPHN|nr:hypothetical protein [Sphingobium boeckii]MBB5684278.1 hypothetical protein [Sphingobium boeckii]